MSTAWCLVRSTVGATLVASAVSAQPSDRQPPCEAFSQSAAVFVGQAGAPVKRWLRFPDRPHEQVMVTPITVDRAYLGISTSVVYLTPYSPAQYTTPGRKYLVYGRRYQPPDMFMASLGMGVKEVERAAEDLAFLDSLSPDVRGGTIVGSVQLRPEAFIGAAGPAEPLEGISVRIFNDTYSTSAVTDATGRFSASGLPAGLFQLVPELRPGLVVLDATTQAQATVRDGGCASSTINARFDGRVRGVLRGPNGSPLSSMSVDLVPMDIAPASTGHIQGMGSVSTNDAGEFDFRGRSPGRYYLGIGLYHAPNPLGRSYPRTYFPGTTDRASAVPVLVGLGSASEGHDFAVATELSKGQLEVIVEGGAGLLKVCVVPLENQVGSWSTYTVRAGETLREPVVEGQRYQVHAHLELADGHLESEPIEFTASTGTTWVTLRPDAPRDLHR